MLSCCFKRIRTNKKVKKNKQEKDTRGGKKETEKKTVLDSEPKPNKLSKKNKKQKEAQSDFKTCMPQ